MTALVPSSAQASSTASGWEFWGYYPTKAACQAAGAELVRNGRAYYQRCDPPHLEIRQWSLFIS